jgi:hypothetical protein
VVSLSLVRKTKYIPTGGINMANKLLESIGMFVAAVAEAAEEDRKRELAMELVNRNTQFLDTYARDLVRDLGDMNTTSYYARRQIEALHLSNDEITYLKRRIIMEASSVDYYAKSQIDHLLRTI